MPETEQHKTRIPSVTRVADGSQMVLPPAWDQRLLARCANARKISNTHIIIATLVLTILITTFFCVLAFTQFEVDLVWSMLFPVIAALIGYPCFRLGQDCENEAGCSSGAGCDGTAAVVRHTTDLCRRLSS